MIIPIGHENSTVRRLPWVTFIIMASCLVVHIMVSRTMNRQMGELRNTAQELIKYYFQHPYLELDPEVGKLLFVDKQRELLTEIFGYQREKPDKYTLEEQQAELDRITQEFKRTLQDIPLRKYGFIPADRTLLGLVGYMFIHGGWFHLLGNLLFLYLSGPFIEDVWGRPLYIVFYVLMGVVSAQLFAIHYPRATAPLIGASGAISGVMGAFLVRYFKSKIKFFYIFFLLIRGTFKAPAWLMLPLWVSLELLNAKLVDAVNPQGGAGVAHWAHVWGFVFGFVFALGMKYFQVEEKYIHRKIESKISFVEPGFEIYEDAMEKRAQGKTEEAFTMLLVGARKHPGHPELAEGLWSIGLELGREKEVSRYLIEAIKNLLKKNQLETAIVYFRQLKNEVPEASISGYFKIKLMEYLAREGDIEEATDLGNELLDEIDLKTPPGIIMQFVQAAKALGGGVERKAVELALEHPDIPEDQKESLSARFDRFQIKMTMQDAAGPEFKAANMPQERVVSKPAPKAQPAESKPKTLKATNVVPLYIREGKIGLKLKNIGNRYVALNKILAVSVARILSAAEKPYYLIDLFIDDPREYRPAVRTIRLSSSTFDPKRLVPDAADSLTALRTFISVLLKQSNARPHPDQDSVLLNKVREFASIKDYELSF